MSTLNTVYLQRREDMLEADIGRDALFGSIDDMWHGHWELPAKLKKPDLREIIDLSPHDALKSGSAILSTSMPHWMVQPLSPTQAEQERCEKIAYAIDYNYRRMNQRGKSSVLWDLVHSCLRYDAVAIWLDYLPYSIKGEPTLRQKHALLKGDFAPIIHKPANVHIQEDSYGLSCVLLCVNMSAKEVTDKWPRRTIKLQTDLDKMKDTGKKRFIYNDMMFYEDDKIKRVIWGSLADGFGTAGGSDEYIIMDEFIDTPFMPWIVMVGGSGLDTEPEYSVHPLLGPLVHAHKWTDLNVFQSILQSEIIKYGRTPRVKTITPSGDGVQIDFIDGTVLNMKTNEQAEPWLPAPIDPNLKELVDRVRAEVSSATLPRILQNPEFAGNTPFASINAMIQTALGGLNPAKRLCEAAHEELALRMLQWYNFDQKPMTAYKKEKNLDTKKPIGTMINLNYDELNPESVIISCKLFAEAPTDFAQRVDIAMKLNQYLKVPRSDALEGLGKENIDALYDQWVQEQEDDTAVTIDLQTQQAKAQAAIQLQVQQAQMGMQMAAQQQMQPQTQPQPGGGNAQESGAGPGQGLNLNTGLPQGANSNLGTTNPSTGNPGVNTREMVTGQSKTGEAVA
jgi:sarcosine oxidase delta subunit